MFGSRSQGKARHIRRIYRANFAPTSWQCSRLLGIHLAFFAGELTALCSAGTLIGKEPEPSLEKSRNPHWKRAGTLIGKEPEPCLRFKRRPDLKGACTLFAIWPEPSN